MHQPTPAPSTRGVLGGVTAPITAARRLWLLTEPLHAVVYFAPEHRRAQDAAGTRGGWMAYFASRSAPLGAAPAEVVTATFYNFAPAMVARAIPDAWTLSSPEAVLRARYEGVGKALRRILGELACSEAVSEAHALLRAGLEACDPAGRTLYAANRSLPWPQDDVLALWHATTLVREFRGDGHVAALLSEGIDGCEAHVLAAAAGASPGEQLRAARGWTLEEWRAAAQRLSVRGLLTPSGEALTAAGRRLRHEVEGATDRLAAPPWTHLGEARTDALRAALAPLCEAVRTAEAVPYPNPMGLPPGRSAAASG